MVEKVDGPGYDRLGRLSRSGKPETGRADGVKRGAARAEAADETALSGEVWELVNRIKSAETYRKDRVHEVLEKLQRGELINCETVREAAEKILREGI